MEIKPQKMKKAVGSTYDPKRKLSRKRPAGAELKLHQIGQDSTTIANSATTTRPSYTEVDSLVKIAQGDTESTRDGNRVTLDKLTIRGQCVLDKNSSLLWTGAGCVVEGNPTFRVIIYLDTQCNGAGANFADLFDTGPVSEFAFGIYNNINSTGRFKILMDKWIEVPQSQILYNPDDTTYHASNSSRCFKKTFKNLGIDLRYGDSTANMSSLRTNNVGMIIMTNYLVADQIKFAYRVRARFYDY